MVDRLRAQAPEGAPDWQQIARQVDQRQWAPPARPWVIRQTWRHLLFAHWPVDPAVLRPRIPAPLDLETFGGEAWVGIVPFELNALTARRSSPRFHLSFPELNVRTYVTWRDTPGVWFFSLDAASLLAVRGARAVYHLPYYWASMQMAERDGWITYRSQRRGNTDVQFDGRYRSIGPGFESAPGSLERWLTARYCLYTTGRGGHLLRAEINHGPWLLEPAEVEIGVNTMASAQGIALDGAPLLHYARQTEVVNWGLQRVN